MVEIAGDAGERQHAMALCEDQARLCAASRQRLTVELIGSPGSAMVHGHLG